MPDKNIGALGIMVQRTTLLVLVYRFCLQLLPPIGSKGFSYALLLFAWFS